MEIVHLDFSMPVAGTDVEVRIDYLNVFHNIKTSSFSAHSHTAYEVYFIECGTMSVRCGQELLNLKPNDILIICPNTVHNVELCSEDIKRFNLRFLPQKPPGASAVPFYSLYRPEPEICREIFQNIGSIHRNIIRANHPASLFRVKAYFSILLGYLLEHILPQDPSQVLKDSVPSQKLNRLDQCIKLDRFFSEHYAEPVTVEHLARELHYSKTHVNRLLKRFWGISFSEKLMQTRLNAAKQYLTASNLPIHQIAEKCGYSTLRGFDLFFEKHTKLRPNEYRNRYTTAAD